MSIISNEHQSGSPGVDEIPKDHVDIDGNPCTLDTLCRREPAWAANIIRTLRARVAELEKLFDDAGQGNYNVLALIDHYQSAAMAESERRREAEARVKELEAWVRDLESDARADAEMLHKRDERITALESQLEAAREETRWRKVAERPAEEDFVLAWCEGESIRRIWFSKRLGFEVLGPANSEPTHWLPLPRPPAILEVEAK